MQKHINIRISYFIVFHVVTKTLNNWQATLATNSQGEIIPGIYNAGVAGGLKGKGVSIPLSPFLEGD